MISEWNSVRKERGQRVRRSEGPGGRAQRPFSLKPFEGSKHFSLLVKYNRLFTLLLGNKNTRMVLFSGLPLAMALVVLFSWKNKSVLVCQLPGVSYTLLRLWRSLN